DFPAATTVELTTNYRSAPGIVAGALQAVAPGTLVPGRRLLAAARPPEVPGRRSATGNRAAGGTQAGTAGSQAAAGHGEADGNRAAPAGHREAAGGRHPAIILYEAPDERAEAEWIAAEIDRQLGGASYHSLDSGRADGQGHGGLGLADIAVLYRTDSQAEPLTQALTRAGLPFQKRSHDRLARR